MNAFQELSNDRNSRLQRRATWVGLLAGCLLFGNTGAPQGDLAQADDKSSTAGKRWAILIGVDDYVELKDLNYCGADQKALHARLQAAGFPADHLFLLHDSAAENRFKPFKANIEKQLKLLLSLVEKDDLLVIGFSGHGIQMGKTAYLCPADANIEKPESLLSLPEIYEQLEKSPAALRLMIVDACRDDPRPRGKRSAASIEELNEFSKAKPPRGILWLGSCGPGQQSQEDDDLKHGVFMHYLLEGWGGKADKNGDGQVSLGELSAFAAAETKKHVARKFGDFQSPYLKGEYEQEILQFDIGRVARGAEAKLTNSIGMELVLIPAGEFEMGSSAADVEGLVRDFSDYKKEYADDEQPRHHVQITQAFQLGKFEVTRGQFAKFVADDGYKTDAERDGKGGWGLKSGTTSFEQSASHTWHSAGWTPYDDNHPVVNVSWNDAKAFCAWLSRKEGKTYRLPTEAEWEYSCRAGTATRHPAGDDKSSLVTIGNVSDATAKVKFPNSKALDESDHWVCTAPVGSFRANAFGMHDMIGNVWEWCEDWYDAKYYSQQVERDPQGAAVGEYRVLRGGSWNLNAIFARSADRFSLRPDFRSYYLGFRVACSSGVKTP